MTDREISKSFTLTEFAAELRRLADALESGESFSIGIDGEEIDVPAEAIVSIEYEQEDESAELEFQLSWNVEADEEQAEDEEGEQEAEDEAA
ncbi:amphi-Trp domain-containing protein [Salmonella enterica subsp. enterica]|nr:amphi-Trp domain-containing protein [Salmonella enterica subsp. enterica]